MRPAASRGNGRAYSVGFRLDGRGYRSAARSDLRRRSSRSGSGARDRLHHQPAPRTAAARVSPVPRQGAAGGGAAHPHEMLLLDLYSALGPIDAITGATTADDILHRIFSTFCIG